MSEFDVIVVIALTLSLVIGCFGINLFLKKNRKNPDTQLIVQESGILTEKFEIIFFFLIIFNLIVIFLEVDIFYISNLLPGAFIIQ